MDFLTQVKEKHHFSSAVDENTKRSQTLILKFQSAAEMKGPITASVAPPSPVLPEERLSLFELPQKKKKKVGLHQLQGRQANMLDATLISRLLKKQYILRVQHFRVGDGASFKVLIKLLH